MTMTWFQLLALAGFLTVMMYRFREALWSIVTVVSWWGLMAYTIANPPGSVTAGSFVHQVMILTLLSVGISCGAWYFFTERKAKRAEFEKINGVANPYDNHEVQDTDNARYREMVHSRLHRR